jgi:hypothetical protein
MKKIITTIIIISTTIISVSSCKKLESINGAILPIVTGTALPHIAIINDNLQTKYGNFSSGYHLEAKLPSTLGVTSLSINGRPVTKEQTGNYNLSSSSDNYLLNNKSLFIGNSFLPITINNVTIATPLYCPFSKKIITELGNWTVSKANGITLNFAPVNSNNVFTTDIAIPAGASLYTVIAIAPSNPANSNATSRYWVIDNDNISFTIQPTDLANYSANESIDIAIGSGTSSQQIISGSNVDIFSMNITHLPALTIN